MKIENIKVKSENSNWYKTEFGSVIFKTGDRMGFGFCVPATGKPYWCKSGFFYPYEKITSPIEVLKAIQKGMKQKGYHNNVTILIHNVSSISFKNHIKLKNYHFNFKNKNSVYLLMNCGKLYLEDKADSNSILICVLQNGELSRIVQN